MERSCKHSLRRQSVDGVGYDDVYDDVYDLYIIVYFFHFSSCFPIYFTIYHYQCQCQYQQQYQYSLSVQGVEGCHIIVLVVCSSFLLYGLVYSYARDRHILVFILCSGLGLFHLLVQEIVQHCVHYKRSRWSQRPFAPRSPILPNIGEQKTYKSASSHLPATLLLPLFRRLQPQTQRVQTPIIKFRFEQGVDHAMSGDGSFAFE